MQDFADVVVLAATNRPEQLDAALLRPGRLDVHLYVPPPAHAGRAQALRLHSRQLPLAVDVDFEALATATERFTGARLRAHLRQYGGNNACL